jgi:hypothetical protein
MLTPKLTRAAAVHTPRAVLRCFSTTTIHCKTPSMGDINPTRDSIEDFNGRQRAFREKLAEAKKRRDAGAFSRSPQTAQPSSSSDSTPFMGGVTEGLGSLSTAATEKAAELARKEPTRKAGPLTNLIYGTKEGREMDAQIEASFSAVLARGKYVHSIVFHDVKPDKVDEYVELVGKWYPKMASRDGNKVHLVGSWRTEVGDVDTFGEFSVFLLHAWWQPGR